MLTVSNDREREREIERAIESKIMLENA